MYLYWKKSMDNGKDVMLHACMHECSTSKDIGRGGTCAPSRAEREAED